MARRYYAYQTFVRLGLSMDAYGGRPPGEGFSLMDSVEDTIETQAALRN